MRLQLREAPSAVSGRLGTPFASSLIHITAVTSRVHTPQEKIEHINCAVSNQFKHNYIKTSVIRLRFTVGNLRCLKVLAACVSATAVP
jgi:hypothetical protein